MKRVFGALAVVALSTLVACSSGSDVVVTDQRPLDEDTADAHRPVRHPDARHGRPRRHHRCSARPLRYGALRSDGNGVAGSVHGRDDSGAAPIDDADLDLIVELWAGYDEAAQGGVESKVAYIASHSYPGLELTEELCAEDPSIEGYVPVVGADLDVDSIVPEPDWVIGIPGSPMDGQTPDGTIYVHDVTISYEDGSADSGPAHTTILDGTAYFFFDCGA